MAEPITSEQHEEYQRIHRTDDFAELKSSYLRFVVPMTVAFMVWYLLYVLASNWAPDLMGTKVVGNINLALVFGLLQFVTTFGIAYLYSRHAGRRLDPLADKIRGDIEADEAQSAGTAEDAR